MGSTWVLVEKPLGSSALFDDDTSISPSFTADELGTYRAELIVTDVLNASSLPDNVTITVTNGGGGDTIAPVITNGLLQDGKGNKFSLSWTTNEPATSDVIINGTVYSSSTLVTSHVRNFTGSRGATYDCMLSSTDASGNNATDGPYVQNN